MRELNRMVEDLERGESEKFVLTKNGQMRAVVVSVETFAGLWQALQRAEELAATGGVSGRCPAGRVGRRARGGDRAGGVRVVASDRELAWGRDRRSWEFPTRRRVSSMM